MRARVAHKLRFSNGRIADVLEEMAQLLEAQAANPFRVAAYRHAAGTVRAWPEPLIRVFARDGIAGLERLPGVGESLAKKIGELLSRGRLRALDNLRRKREQDAELTSLPTVGPLLADRIRNALGIESLEEVYSAAYDGRLSRIEGIGRKRVQAIRESLAVRLHRTRPEQVPSVQAGDPPVADLLAIDRTYRERAAQGRLITVAPRRFNPTGAAWLPILRTKHRGRRYCALYANTSRSHQLNETRDWVIIYSLEKQFPGQWTLITSRFGALRGRRIVRGRETECREHYRQTSAVQLSLLAMDTGDRKERKRDRH